MESFLVLVLAVGIVAQQSNNLPEFRGAYGNTVEEHFRFGSDVGRHFKSMIQERVKTNTELQDTFLPWLYHNSTGKEIYNTTLANHLKRYPQYMQELYGLAAGSEVVFEAIFMMNLEEEFAFWAPASGTKAPLTTRADHCSDYAMPPYEIHNEDNDFSTLNHTYMLHVVIDGQNFSAYTYAGELPSGAFGWSYSGQFAFTLNWVGPKFGDLNGLGRAFFSRDLLQASSMEDGVARVAVGGYGSGHNYQLMDLKTKKIMNLEVAPHGRFTMFEVPAGGSFFHANQYQTLVVPQVYSDSSSHRLARVKQLPPPKTVDDLINIIGDQHDVDGSDRWPIYHDDYSHAHGDQSDYTIATVLFDLEQKTATLFHGNPRHRQVLIAYNL